MINWFDKSADPLKIIKELQAEKGITKREAEAVVRKQVPKESDYQKKIKAAIPKKYPDALVVKIAQGEFSQCGIPDLMAVVEGHFFGFEVKRPYFHRKTGGTLQERTIDWIRKAGGTAGFISYPQEALDMIEDYLKEAGKHGSED